MSFHYMALKAWHEQTENTNKQASAKKKKNWKKIKSKDIKNFEGKTILKC